MSSTATTLRIAVPSLEPALAGPAESTLPMLRLPAAEWLVARGDRSPEPQDSWRQWLLDGAGLGGDLLGRFPAGPSMCASWTGSSARGTWACAAPVHLVTAIDHLQLAAPVPLPLDAAESAELLASLDAHLAGTGFRLHSFPGRGWLLECPPDLDCAAVEPEAAVGRNLRELLPGGRDAARVRGLVNELQMLLHEHPANERRALRGAPAMNSLWLWGFGTTVEPRAQARDALLTDDAWLAGLWRVHGGEVASPDQLGDFLRRGATVLRVALAPMKGNGNLRDQLAAMDQSLLAPARAALTGGVVQCLSLCTGRAAFDVPRSARWRFWRRSRALGEALR
jgi:hypothetical protein